jgi:hypothetical protein
MEEQMIYDETWGIQFPRIREYFLEQSGVTELSETEYSYLGASISLQPLPPRQMGSVHIARTRVVISGESDADDIHRRFFMRFLSAGG